MSDPLMDIAWRDFIVYAWCEEQHRKAFEADTGMKMLPPPRTPMEAMIDKATGVNGKIMRAFMLWATENLWGLDDAPDKVREEIEAAKAGAK